MWDRSNSPAALRTAWCSEISPAYLSGISQPANAVMVAPRPSWTARSGVDRGAAGSGELIDSPPCLVRAGTLAAPAWARLAYRARCPRPALLLGSERDTAERRRDQYRAGHAGGLDQVRCQHHGHRRTRRLPRGDALHRGRGLPGRVGEPPPGHPDPVEPGHADPVHAFGGRADGRRHVPGGADQRAEVMLISG